MSPIQSAESSLTKRIRSETLAENRARSRNTRRRRRSRREWATSSDVPVVAADIPAFREIGGDAAFYADPHSAQALSGAMEDALFVAAAREMLIKRGRERVREFSWERSAQRLVTLFSEVHATNRAAKRWSREVRARRRVGLHPAPTSANARAALG